MVSTGGGPNCHLKRPFQDLLPTHPGSDKVSFQWRRASRRDGGSPGGMENPHRLFTIKKSAWFRPTRAGWNGSCLAIHRQGHVAEEATREPSPLATTGSKSLLSALISKLCAVFIPPAFLFHSLFLPSPLGSAVSTFPFPSKISSLKMSWNSFTPKCND